MSIEIKAPQFPESVADGTIVTWHKQPGESVSRDELIVDIETDKVVLEIVAPADGQVSEIIKNEGDVVVSQELIGHFVEGDISLNEEPSTSEGVAVSSPAAGNPETPMSPAARKLAEENNLTAEQIVGTGKGGRITKEDVVKKASEGASAAAPAAAAAPAVTAPAEEPSAAEHSMPGMIPQMTGTPDFASQQPARSEKRVPMTRLRKRIAERLLEAKNSTAMLTTFNEVNMAPVMELRKKYKDQFEKTHNGTRLGFMSFFVKAATEALRRHPEVNASLDVDDVVYHGYYDIGVAVSSDRGLVVPILRDTDQMSLAGVESTIRNFSERAQAGQLGIDEMQGGTFTITNGGVFGSLMSTPILNPPQTAILGMHKIQERPMAVNGEVKILPMMYLALSYDHRLIDGKEAVQFLVAIKDMLEDPARILLEL
ncbi:2-oxoglutarate dehydrogenase complex dihydrolipoyllysine-residue succinyltransferase [Reinekea marinisedimentorum]|uniref:Dihydrolipoyllysine-residue succinyltransferase component of 2-oxoglutarate dehydrogenase complex n=1 Tax=Reinekea marinisedimentorum TaxID=230495 RepID=A0A4R3IB32_9GAMM|nr:2-oxoglutarate dehydrogenase complex dihydrolipoyllysine-residue succinyltransferase [Reinekea marinisedimentorum]TCS42461.1 2-oxoglutarate dehydrogenase E2 component (dihydrolipoamide succinyltransferase) [Reinekea marinisedimentorum]